VVYGWWEEFTTYIWSFCISLGVPGIKVTELVLGGTGCGFSFPAWMLAFFSASVFICLLPFVHLERADGTVDVGIGRVGCSIGFCLLLEFAFVCGICSD